VDSYQQGDTVAFVEDIHHEFKAILENQNLVEGIFDQIEIDINAFLNTKVASYTLVLTKTERCKELN